MAIILRGYKFYHFRTPKWFIKDEIPGDDLSPGNALVLLKNILGEISYIYGYYIYASEENKFELFWNFGDIYKSINISLPGPGTVMYANTVPINLDSPHTEGSIGLVVVNQPSSGSIYQAGILASGCMWAQL
jgi:hypothetical protein